MGTMLIILIVIAFLLWANSRSKRPRAQQRPESRQAHRRAPSRTSTPEQEANTHRQIQLANRAEQAPRVQLGGDGFGFDIVGESFYQDTLRKLDGGRLADGATVVFNALVIPDPENPFSKSGAPILVSAEGFGPVGHFSETDAVGYRAVSEMLRSRGAVGVCEGWLMGGRSDAPTIGVRLSIQSPREILGAEAPSSKERATDTPPAPREPRLERVYASTACPHCGVALSPPPKTRKKCPVCSQPMWVRSAADGNWHLLREGDLAAFAEQRAIQREGIKQQRQREEAADAERLDAEQREVDRARGVLLGSNDLEVVGESRYRKALVRIMGQVDPYEWVSKECIARLVREPDNRHDENAVRVEVDGSAVGYLDRDDAEDYQEMLEALEDLGREALVRVEVKGKSGRYGVFL